MRGDLAGAGLALYVEALAAGKLQEVAGIGLQVEADEIRAKQPAHELLAPGQLAEKIGRREGDMQEESDGEIRALLAQDAGQKLQLVVLYPHGGALGGDFGYFICETQVDLAIGVPPIAVIGRGDDEIVVERPQGGIRKTLIKALEIGLGELDRVQQHAGIGAEGLWCGIGHTGPAHPASLV